MRNSCGGFEVATKSCLIVPDPERQVNKVGTGVNVDVGTGLGVKVISKVGVVRETVWVGKLSFEGEQAESMVRSKRELIKRIA
jgi:hypothetical protein